MSRARLLFLCFWMVTIALIASLIYFMVRGNQPQSKMWWGCAFAGYVVGCCIFLLVVAQPKSPYEFKDVPKLPPKVSEHNPLWNILFSLSLMMIYVSSMDGKMTTINAKLAETNRQLERANSLLMRHLQTLS